MATGVLINQTADPSAGVGVVAGIGSILLRDNAGAGELWEKTGAADTAWTLLGTGGSGAPTDATYLVGAAHGDLSAEIVVGATPGGELGNTWASPTVDATHSGSTHAAAQAAAEATAAGALTGHTGDATAAHAASAVAFTPAGTIAATDVQAAIEEVASEAGGGIAATIVDAKGDLIAATAADTVARLAVGTNGQVLAAASAATPGVRWDPNPGRPPFRSGAGFYYSSPFVAGGLTNLVQDTLYASPFYVPYDITTSSINIATGGVASTSARLGIYADGVGKPGALVVDAGTIATTAGGHKTIALVQALTAGWYWLSGAVQGGAGQWFCGGNNGPTGWVALYTPYAASSINGYKRTGVSGALPDPWGATLTEQTQIPIVWLAF